MNKYEKYLNNIFNNRSLYLFGSDICEDLVNKFNVKSENARKILQRANDKGVINSSKPFTVGKGQYIYYSKESFLEEYKLKEMCKDNRPPVYRLLELIELNGGIVSYYEAMKITASPVKKSTTKVSLLKDILSSLNAIGITEIIKDNRGILYVISMDNKEDKNILMDRHYSRMYLDTVFISDMLYWLRKHNLIDNKYVRYRNKSMLNKGVEHNNIVWDAFAYTHTTGIHTNHSKNDNDNKKTLVVLDVVVNRSYENIDLQGFLSRIDIVRNSVKSGIRKVLPIIISKELSDSVIFQLKNLGIIHLNLGTVFGEKIYEIISKLEVIKDAELCGINKEEKVFDNVESTLSNIRDSGQEINLQNIKGDLFEIIIYQILTLVYPNSSILHGKILKDNDKTEKYEYDFIVNNHSHNEIVIIEAKGYKSTSEIDLGDYDTKNTIKWFFRKTFPFAKLNYLVTSDGSEFKACYITTGIYSDKASEFLETISKSKIKSNNLNVSYDREELLKLMIEKGAKKAIQIINRYYN